MIFKQKLPIPMDVKARYPVSDYALKIKAEYDREIEDIFCGKSKKMLLIVGPCSADREDAVLEYCTRLKELSEQVKDVFVIIPRVFTNKPRTTGEGYKGMVHQPDPNAGPDPFRGILATRALHANVLTKCSMPTADELLYPANYRYLSDLISYLTVGARSTENQEHRLTASGLTVPVGFKNPVYGDLEVTVNSVAASRTGHSFIYRGWDVETTGNPLSHAVLRGYTENGEYVPNYCEKTLCSLYEKFVSHGLENKAVIVDASHGNSAKCFENQPRVFESVIKSVNSDSLLRSFVKGIMLESYLLDGSQEIGPDELYGKSITDSCLGWEKTRALILDTAEKLAF